MRNLNVLKCKAFRKEDKQYVLHRIRQYTTIDAFNANLRNFLAGMVVNSVQHIGQLEEMGKMNERLKMENIELENKNKSHVSENERLKKELEAKERELAAQQRESTRSGFRWPFW